MPHCDRPCAPIPEPLRGSETGTFTHHSIVQRLPDIGRRVRAENDFPPTVERRLYELLQEIPEGKMRPPAGHEAPDAADWTVYVAPYREQNWLEAPWFFAETYFYRRIMEATGYFPPGPGQGVDPFGRQKMQGLELSQQAIRALAAQANQMLEREGGNEAALRELLAVSLWGNQADLSLWPAEDGEKPDHRSEEQQAAHVLVDDRPAVLDYLAGGLGRVVFLMDNAGFELVTDLVLANFLLDKGLANEVHLHLKPHPTFVSDATIRDVRQAIDRLGQDGDPAVAALGARLQSALSNGRLCLKHHFFWTSPLAMWQMPQALAAELGQADLLFSKGDANYRRLLGDRHWPFSTPFDDVVCYLPAPLLALRTLKSEVAAGLGAGQPERLARQEPDWLTNGRWGVIQFWKGKP